MVLLDDLVEMWFFQLSVGVKASLVESQQLSSVPFISFHFLSYCIHIPWCFFHVAFSFFYFAFMSFRVPFILPSCPFIFRRYVSNIQVFERWYAQTGQVNICPNPRVFFHVSLSVIVFVLVSLSFWRPVPVAIFRLHKHVHVEARYRIVVLLYFYHFLYW